MTDFQELEFRMCTLEDANKLVDHFNRSLVHLWRDEDTIFGFGSEEPFDEQKWRKEFTQSLGRSLEQPGWLRNLLVLDEGRIVGEVNLRTEVLKTSQHRAKLGIGLEKAYRGQGIGRSLMKKIIDWARRETQLEWIDLGVFHTNKIAYELYKSMGFIEWGRCADRFRVAGKNITDISMSLKLSP